MIAAGDVRDQHHKRVLAFFRSNTAPLVTNWIALAEAAYHLGDNRTVQRRMLQWASSSLLIDESTTQDAPRIIDIMAKYDDLPADLADASLLAMCERRGIDHIASLDSDFEVYRTKSRKTLVNVLAGKG